MHLVIDAGNTNIKFVFIENDKIVFSKAINKKELKNLSLADFHHLKPSKVVLGSVAPSTNKKICRTIKKIFNLGVEFITPNDFSKFFDLKNFNLKTQGVDILAFALYIAKKYKTGIGISFGTATFVVYVKNKVLLGSSISPGIETGIHILESRTELISTKDFATEINMRHVDFYGTTTKTALLSGAKLMAIGTILSSQREFKKVVSGKFITITSGGKNAFLNIDKLLAKHIDNVVALGYYILKK